MKKTELTIGTEQGRDYHGCEFFGPADILEKTVDILVSCGFDAFTILECQGYWKGIPEDSYRVEIWGDEYLSYEAISKIARDCQQDCIMMVRDNGKPEFVEG